MIKIFLLITFLAVGYGSYSIFLPNFENLNDSYPHIILGDDLKMNKIVFKNEPSNTWINISEISPHLTDAIVISEDWSFYEHFGLDIEQIKMALKDFLMLKRVRGASTITQQLVKNLYLSQEKTLKRKGLEALLAVKLERELSKQRILELYLNVIEFGKGVYGIGHAANYYFKKSAFDLTIKESAFLAMLLPNPIKYSQSFKKGLVTPFAQKTIESIIHKLKVVKKIDNIDVQLSLEKQFSWENAEKTTTVTIH